MNASRIASAAALALVLVSGCKKKPECANLPVPADGKDLVLDGGKVCKDSGHAMTVGYDGIADEDALRKTYESALTARGWRVLPGQGPGKVHATKQSKSTYVTLVKSEFGGSIAFVGY